MNKDIIAISKEGLLHGYCESYYDNGQLDCRGVYFNSKRFGYWGSYFSGGRLAWKGYFLDNVKTSYGNAEGNCYIWNRVEA